MPRSPLNEQAKFDLVLHRKTASGLGSFIGKEALSQPFRIRQRDEMTAGNFLYFLSEPFACDTPLKLDREKAVISSRQNMNGDVGPVLEAARFAENSVGFLARLLRAGAQHVMRHVVQEVRRHIEFRRIAAAHRSFFPRCDGSCCIPPCASRLAEASESSH